VEGYLATQTITQRVNHWVIGNIPLLLRERYKLRKDGTGIDGIYETHDGSQIAYQVKYRQKHQLTFAEVAPFLGITEQFSDRVIFTNAATLSDKAIVRTRWVNREVFRALSPNALSAIEAWLKQKPLPVVRAMPDPNYQTQALADIKATLATHDRATVVMASLEEAWEEGFEALTAFKAREGHCGVAASHVEGTYRLGKWVTRQRTKRNEICAERRQRLDAIGFVWDPLEEAWEEGFEALTAFKAREGHCRVPQAHLEGSIKLGMWIGTQRRSQNTLPAERRQRLDAIGFVWDPLKDAWEEGVAALTTFKAREGHCRIPNLHREGTFRLGQWVGDLRKHKDMVLLERRKRLDDIGFVWDVRGEAWEEALFALNQFKAREGHCNVPQLHREGTIKLGKWVAHQRRDRDTIPTERKQRLDAIGFVWGAIESFWEQGFATLATFLAREGHCRVSDKHVEGTFKLGSWVRNQRARRETIPLNASSGWMLLGLFGKRTPIIRCIS
jgi:hypothetical protein